MKDKTAREDIKELKGRLERHLGFEGYHYLLSFQYCPQCKKTTLQVKEFEEGIFIISIVKGHRCSACGSLIAHSKPESSIHKILKEQKNGD